MMQVFTTLDLTPPQICRLLDALGADQLHVGSRMGSDTEARAAFDQCEVVFGNPSADWVAQSPRLRWLQLESVGFGEYAALNWADLGKSLRMTNLAGFFAEPVAESILAGILGLYRGIDHLVLFRQQRHWEGDALRPLLKTLAGTRVVLFGFGAINRRLGELLGPFRCEVTTFAREWRADDLDAALALADIVVSTVPDTHGTRNTFDRVRVSRLKPGAIFANFGRGSVVDDDALADLLELNRLGGAIIDVTRDEPLPADHRFWTCPNLILTQHTGGGTRNEIDRKITLFLDNLTRYRCGEALDGLVDIARGY
jgi:phosphoglycerate dehydrogenase-like enzyme